MLLFGSRARGNNRPDSDIDVFIESDEELSAIPRSLLIDNGGPVDAFYPPDDDGWAYAVGHEESDSPRMLLCWDKWGSRVEFVPISVKELMALCAARVASGASRADPC